MSRWGYLIAVTLLLALGGYAFWPQSLGGDAVSLWQGERPQDFTVLDPRYVQIVHGYSIKIAGFDRAVDAAAVGRLWETLRHVSVDRSRIQEGITSDRLSPYGIDGEHGIDAGTWRLRWGSSGSLGYLWDGQRILAVTPTQLAAVVDASRRLDERTLISGSDSLSQLVVDGTTYDLRSGCWIDASRSQRPGVNRHVTVLVNLIATVRLDSLHAADPSGVVTHRCDFRVVKDPGVVHHVEIHAVDQGGLVVIDQYPPQAISQADLGRWGTAMADMRRDYLLELDGATARSQVKGLSIARGPDPWFSVERQQLAYRPGETSWELTWPDGRESASEAAVARTLEGLCSLWVDHAEAGPDPSPPSPLARTFLITLQNDGRLDITIDGDRVWTSACHGRLQGGSTLAMIAPSDLLDLALLDAAPERISKVQRLCPGTGVREVDRKSDNGTWTRVYPAPVPVDAVAMGRLVRALTNSHAVSARVDTPEDRAGMQAPDLDLSVRLEPRAAGASRMEINDERDTVAQDRGFAIYQDLQHAWHAVDVEGGVSYEVDAELVGLLRAPLQSNEVFPLVPGLVQELDLQSGEEHLRLSHEGDEWWMDEGTTHGTSARRPADALQVRRYLRALSELTATSREPAAPLILPNQATMVVTVVMPAAQGQERLVLSLLSSDQVGAEASVTTTEINGTVPPGRIHLAAAAVASLLPISAERFAGTLPASAK